jgi:pimeloyl-ACP methyl ester carboxylesterase
MANFVLIPGAGGVAWYWKRVVAELEARGQNAIAVDLPGEDPSAGLAEYAALVASAGRGLEEVVLVAQSMGAFTAPLVLPLLPVRRLVLVNAMIPVPGERAGEWWGNVDSAGAMRAAAIAGGYSIDFDLETHFLHDVPSEVAAEGEPYQRNEVDRAFEDVCDFDGWPADVEISAVAGRDDRFFPLALERRLARERLGIEVDVLPGGHLNALSQPAAIADYLVKSAGQT